MTDAPDSQRREGRLLDAVRAQREPLLEFVERLARCESPSSDPASQAAVFDVLEEGLDAAGFEARRLPGATSGGQLVAAPFGSDFGGFDFDIDAEPAPPASRRPKQTSSSKILDPAGEVPAVPASRRPAQLLLGHSDTVWAHGTLAEMPVVCDGTRLHGPGVFDMKAGLAQTVFALRTLKELDLRPSLMPLMLVNSDEEIGSPDSAPLIRCLAQQAARVFVMEPALGPEGRLKTARKGVGQFAVAMQGKAAHAGLDPEGGASAILELAHQVRRLFECNDVAAGISVNVGVIEGGTRANVIAAHSRAIVDVRVPDAVAARRITDAIYGLAPVTDGVTLEVSGSVARPPLERNERNQALWHRARRLADRLGLHLEQGFAGGASDGNLTSPTTATLDGLGAVGDGAHAAHEHIEIEPSLERCALLASLILEGDAED